MRDLIRAVIRFACEVQIYVSERILEQLDAERPMHDEPLPDMPGPIDDFTGYSMGCPDSSLLAWGAAHIDHPEPQR